jgi:hypothetical protein
MVLLARTVPESRLPGRIDIAGMAFRGMPADAMFDVMAEALRARAEPG